MQQILWIGSWESEEGFKEKASKGNDSSSAQVSQSNLIYGIEKITGLVFDSVNESILPHYPVYKDKFVEPMEWSHTEGASDKSVGFSNGKYINRLNAKNSLLKETENWLKTRYKGGELIVFAYSMRSAPMTAACKIKKVIPQAKIFLIITDLPQFMDLGQSKVKAFLKSIDWLFIKKMQSKFDGFILYAEKMAEFLNVPEEKWILMEGSYCSTDATILCEKKKKAVMYSGKLDAQYGIKLLLDAFMQLTDDDIELWLTGGGNAEDYIRDCEKKDPRIKFFGFLPSRQDVLQKQAEASVLINMRLPSEKASAYCFPSKLFEYMVTGTPVLTFDIAGIPREFLQYIYVIKEESADSVATEIQRVLNLSEQERIQKGKNATEFIKTQKNAVEQSKKIINFINKQNKNV